MVSEIVYSTSCHFLNKLIENFNIYNKKRERQQKENNVHIFCKRRFILYTIYVGELLYIGNVHYKIICGTIFKNSNVFGQYTVYCSRNINVCFVNYF